MKNFSVNLSEAAVELLATRGDFTIEELINISMYKAYMKMKRESLK